MSGIKTGLFGMAFHALGLSSYTTEDSPLYPETSSYGADIASNPWIELSLANAGMPWFPDLLVTDPYHALSYMVSALMFTNIYISKNGSIGTPNRLQRSVRRSMLLVALAIGPLLQDLPAGLLLYWVSSTSSVIVWNLWLDHKYPGAKGFEPCKRKLLLPPPKPVRRR